MELNIERIINDLKLLMAESNLCTNQKYVEACGLFCSVRRMMVSDLANSSHNECNKNCEHYSPPHIYCVLKDALSLINELTEENERLKSVEFTCGFVKPHKVLECPIFDEIAKAKADTVREMQTEIETRCIKGGIYPAFVKSTINQIADEMLGGETK